MRERFVTVGITTLSMRGYPVNVYTPILVLGGSPLLSRCSR
ncbi:hypothetical protein I553_5554 [Mycobacterium xenopi 4042]|uniref:Uncharacterized protein n=1 Tax=Mycobacterium xenopi 4042 TaxID=1299334 RepID=X7ZX87_MYCXE|nr:hypothetical protein I553_5554 [Mycobacterium xenopi 4042]